MKYAFIAAHVGEFDVKVMCHVLSVSKSGYYVWRKRPKSNRTRENKRLLVRIEEVHEKSRKTYGSPRVHMQLRKMGETCSRGRVARLMSANGIRARQKREFHVTTDSAHDLPVAANLLERDFEVTGPNRVWVSDITYVPTGEGWLYLSAVMDLYSRQIVGWSMKETLRSVLSRWHTTREDRWIK